MRLSQQTSVPNVNPIHLKTKMLLMYHCGCHGNPVTIAMRYVADPCHPKEPPYQIWTQYDIRQRSYWYNYCGCYGTIATRYVADAYHPIEPSYQIWT